MNGSDHFDFQESEFEELDPEEGNGNAPRPRFEPIHLHQVLELPPVDFLVDNLLTRNGPSVIAGFSGNGKSLLATDLTLSVASGHAFRGDQAVRSGLTVYIAAEGYRGFGQRVGAWLDYHAVTADELNALPVYFVPDAPQLMDATHVAVFLKLRV
jgi:AAA domain